MHVVSRVKGRSIRTATLVKCSVDTQIAVCRGTS